MRKSAFAQQPICVAIEADQRAFQPRHAALEPCRAQGAVRMGADGHASEAGEAVRKLVAAAIFGEFATGAKVADPELLAAPSKDAASAANSQPRKTPRVLCEYSAVIVGRQTYLAKTGRRDLPAENCGRRPSGQALMPASFRP